MTDFRTEPIDPEFIEAVVDKEMSKACTATQHRDGHECFDCGVCAACWDALFERSKHLESVAEAAGNLRALVDQLEISARRRGWFTVSLHESGSGIGIQHEDLVEYQRALKALEEGQR